MTATRLRRVEAPRVWGSIAVAAVGNLLLYGLGRASGVSFLVPGRDGGPSSQVPWGAVLVMSVVPLAIGWAAVALLPRWRRGLRMAAAVVAVASMAMPLSLDTDTDTKVLLAVMHVIAGAAFVLGVQPLDRREPAAGGHQVEAA